MAREKAVVDASVIVKWYLKEAFTEQALKIRERFISGALQFIMPSILPFEVLNALKFSDVFNSKELQSIALSIEQYGFELYSLTGRFAQSTAKIAMDCNITIYDASYIALAEVYKAKLYTADEKIIENCNRAIHIKEV